MNRRILTFSGRMRSGKDVLCKAMEKAYNATTFSMATHLKKLCCEILDIELKENTHWDINKLNEWKNNNTPLQKNGIILSETAIKKICQTTGFSEENVKELCDGLVIHNVRELLQGVGTDIIRRINPEWHVWKTISDIGKLPEDCVVCVDDVRYINELKAFKYAGADSFFIIRGNAENVSNHESEIGLSHLDFPDNRVILNLWDEERLCNEFVSEFENTFNRTIEKPIFLIDYPDYKNVNRKFGLDRTPLIEEVIRQNKENDIFLKEGLITFRNNTKFNLKQVLEDMGIAETYRYEQKNGRFLISNPLAYENLKLSI